MPKFFNLARPLLQYEGEEERSQIDKQPPETERHKVKKMNTNYQELNVNQIGAEELQPNARCLADYHLAKERYLLLCRRYGLNPFDLDILDHRLDRLPRRDKVAVVRLIIRLVRLERSLRESVGERLLFPLTIEQSERTGYLVPLPVAAGAR